MLWAMQGDGPGCGHGGLLGCRWHRLPVGPTARVLLEPGMVA